MNNATIEIGTGEGGVAESNVALTYFSRLPAGYAEVVGFSLHNANAPLQVDETDLVAGENEIAVPVRAAGVLLVPPIGSTGVISLRGVPLDTGLNLSRLAPTFLAFDVPPPTSLMLVVVSNITGFKFYWV